MEKLIFISHSSKDAKTASEICDYIEKNGRKCFIAPRDIRSGYEYAEEIVDGIDNSSAIVLLISKNSNESPHVLREVERAVSKRIPIIIYKLEDVELSKSMEYFIMTHQWIDAKKKGEYSEILECIRNIETGEEGKKTDAGAAAKTGMKKRYVFAAAAVILIILAGILIKFLKDKSADEDMNSENKDIQGSEIIADDNIRDIEAGDMVIFGTYNNEPIEWRVLKISEDKKEAVIVSEHILTMKAFAVPESGKYNSDGETSYNSKEIDNTNNELLAYIKGNSEWQKSAIRTWLNSEEENVKYQGQAPIAAAMTENKNSYNTEKGFLAGFTDDELAAIKETEITTKGNVLSEEEYVVTKDRVYLLSLDELEWFEEANISIYAVPTDAAVDSDATKWYDMLSLSYGINSYCWWLREPVEGKSFSCYLVGNGYNGVDIIENIVATEGFGIRPAMTVNIQNESIKEKDN